MIEVEELPGGLRATITGDEAKAIFELEARQELSQERVLLQAIRLYQSQVLGPIGGPYGCMGD